MTVWLWDAKRKEVVERFADVGWEDGWPQIVVRGERYFVLVESTKVEGHYTEATVTFADH